jgi:hypothetical protein
MRYNLQLDVERMKRTCMLGQIDRSNHLLDVFVEDISRKTYPLADPSHKMLKKEVLSRQQLDRLF